MLLFFCTLEGFEKHEMKACSTISTDVNQSVYTTVN
jgi:hypothetical protein